MPRIKSINQADAIGTCHQDYVSVSYQTIVAKYGPPTTSDGYKVDAEWIIQWEDGQVGTIYNWKSGKNYLGDDIHIDSYVFGVSCFFFLQAFGFK